MAFFINSSSRFSYYSKFLAFKIFGGNSACCGGVIAIALAKATYIVSSEAPIFKCLCANRMIYLHSSPLAFSIRLISSPSFMETELPPLVFAILINVLYTCVSACGSVFALVINMFIPLCRCLFLLATVPRSPIVLYCCLTCLSLSPVALATALKRIPSPIPNSNPLCSGKN